MKKANFKDGTFFVILAGICWGTMSIFVHFLSARGYDSLQIACIRDWFSVLLLAVFFLIKDKSLFRIDPKDLWMFVGTGILSLSFFSYCYFTTIVAAGAAVGVVLLYTSPVFVMAMSAIFFQEKITKKKVLGLVLTILGCILVAGLIGSGESLSFKIILIGLGSGFGYALYSIFANVALKKYSSLTITFYTLLLSGISMLFLCKPHTLVANVEAKDLVWFIGVALVCTVIPYITYTLGLSTMDPGRAAVLVTVEPLVGCLIGFFVWKEAATPLKIAGIVLIFAAILLFSIKEKEKV